MTQKGVLYTDGHEVTVTDSFIQVRKQLYMLSGITKLGYQVIRPDRFSALIGMILGGVLIALADLKLFPANLIDHIKFYSVELDINAIVMIVGVVLVIVSSLLMGLMKERHAVRIATAEGEKNVVVSHRKEYINQIIAALHKAYGTVVAGPGKPSKKENSKKGESMGIKLWKGLNLSNNDDF